MSQFVVKILEYAHAHAQQQSDSNSDAYAHNRKKSYFVDACRAAEIPANMIEWQQKTNKQINKLKIKISSASTTTTHRQKEAFGRESIFCNVKIDPSRHMQETM